MQLYILILLTIFVLIPLFLGAFFVIKKMCNTENPPRGDWEWAGCVFLLLAICGCIYATLDDMIFKYPRPEIYINSVEIFKFELTSKSRLTTLMNVKISATTPNKDVMFFYYPFSVSLTTPVIHGVDIGNGSIPYLEHLAKETISVDVVISGVQQLDDSAGEKLKAEMEDEINGVPLEINFRSKVISELEGTGSPQSGVKISCKGIRATVPTGTGIAAVLISDAKCKVEMDIIGSMGVAY